MNRSQGVKLRGTGSAVPPRTFRNEEFEAGLETSDDWIRSRTGIRERRFCDTSQTTATLAAAAGRQALEAAELNPDDIDLVICATLTADMVIPSTACLVQAALGCRSAAAFDLNAACSGFVYALAVADQFVRAGTFRNVLVIGGDSMSRVVDFQDRTTCVLFGDGAGAVVLSAGEGGNPGGCWFRLRADGNQGEAIRLAGFATREPGSSSPFVNGHSDCNFLRMNGREVFKFAASAMVRMIREALSENDLTLDDISLIIPHQANQRILDNACEQLAIPPGKLMVNLDRYGNTSAASIPIALDEAVRGGRVKPLDRVLLLTFGGGLTWASALLRV